MVEREAVCELIGNWAYTFSNLSKQDWRYDKYKGDFPKLWHIGLWKSSRHPNYLGEILFWWGLFIIYISVAPGEWLTAIGAVANTLLFIFVSIPLMEKRQLATKPAYAEYRRNTRML